MPTAKPTVIIRVKLVLFHFVVIIKVILVFLVEFFHFSDSSNHREDFGFIGRLLFCQFSTFLIILSDSTILIIFKFGLINFLIYFRILQFSFWILQFSLFLDFCFDYFQILPFSLFVGSTFLPIFITDYHAKLQPRFSYQYHSRCAIDVQTRFLASSHHKHPACSPIRISVF